MIAGPGLRTLALALIASAAIAGEAPFTEADAESWPMARGCVEGSGRSGSTVTLPLREAWQRRFDGTAFEATPIIANGMVYVGDLDGTFHALSLSTGETRWSLKGEAGFSAAAAFVTTVAESSGGPASLVVAGDSFGVVRAFDAKTGKIAWEHERDGEISGGPSVMVDPADGGQARILVGSQDASLVCLSAANGKEIWSHSIADQIRCMPTVVAGRILIAGCDGRLHAIDAATGRPTGEVAIDGPTGTTPAGLGTAVFFGTEGGTFYRIDVAATADVAPAIRWRMKAAGGGQSYRSSAAIAEGPTGPLAIVGTRGRAVEAFSATDGSRLWRAAMRGKVDASSVVVRVGETGAAVIAADTAGRIAALRPDDGSELWTFDAGGGFTASPAVAAGRVVLAGEDGTVWCFGGAE